jgi:hypothetical protein
MGLFGGASEEREWQQTTSATKGSDEWRQGLWQVTDEIYDTLFPRTEYNFGYDATGTPSDRQKIYQEYVEMQETKNFENPGPNLKAFIDKHNINPKTTNDATFRGLLDADTEISGTQSTAGKAKSYLDMAKEDQAAREQAYGTYQQQLTDAFSPYNAMAQQYINQGNSGAGMFKPTTISFGGQTVGSFVPKANRLLADQLLGYQGNVANNNTEVAKAALTSGLLSTPNIAQTTYMDKLLSLFPQLAQDSESFTETKGSSTTTSDDPFADLMGIANMGLKAFGVGGYGK